MNEVQTAPNAATEATTERGASTVQAVSVDIYDQLYHLRGTDPEHIACLAQMVDSKMRAVAAHGGPVDSLRVAVLASLNLADELSTLRARYETLAGSTRQKESTVRSRAGDLSHMLDEVLDERRAG